MNCVLIPLLYLLSHIPETHNTGMDGKSLKIYTALPYLCCEIKANDFIVISLQYYLKIYVIIGLL